MKYRIRILLSFILLGMLALPVGATISIPHVFVGHTTIASADLNSNFSTLGDKALNRTGDTLTGNLAVNAGVTIDGADISVYLNGGKVNAMATGVDSVKAGGGITAGTGNVGIVDVTGKIPAFTSTYFTLLDASALTGSPTFTTLGATTGNITTANHTTLNVSGVASLNGGAVITTPSSVMGIALKGRASDNSSGLYYESNDGVTAYGFQLASATGLFWGSQTNIPISLYTNNTIKGYLQASGGFSLGSATDPGLGGLLTSGAIYKSNYNSYAGNHTYGATEYDVSLTSSGTLTLPTCNSGAIGREIHMMAAGAAVTVTLSGTIFPVLGTLNPGDAVFMKCDGGSTWLVM